MWLIKLPFRILAFPIMLIVGTLSVFYTILLHVGTFVAGVTFLLFAFCIVSSLVQHMFLPAAIIFAAGVLVFLGIMFAEAIALGLEALLGKIGAFIFS